MAEGRLAVIGAGLSGLAAALELKRHGYEVELFERSRLVGGKATSFEIDGVEVDNGQHVFLACCEQFIGFLREIEASTDGSDGLVYLQPRFEALLLTGDGSPIRMTTANLPAPWHLMPILLAARQLGFMGRMQLALALNSMRKPPSPVETLGAWLSRHHQGHRSITGFWEPFVVPALNAQLSEVAAHEAAFVIRTAFLENASSARFGYSRVPLGHLAQRALNDLDRVHLKTPVVAIAASENGHRRAGLELKDGTVSWFDGAVLAVPPDKMKSLVKSPKAFGLFGLDQFRCAPIVDVHLWYGAPARTILGNLDFAALLDSPVQWVFEKPAPPGESYLCCSISAAYKHIGRTKEQLVEMAHRELTSRVAGLRDVKLVRSAATRDREATFIPSVGLVRPGPQTRFPQITVAGAWTDTGWPATMESAIRSGRQAAQALHGSISG